ELYFPDAAEKVVKQFLSHYSSESFTYFASEIKGFNEKVAKDLVEYLNDFYRGINKFAAGVNRADYLLTGKLPSDSVIQVKWSGWDVFVYRSSLASSFLPVETNIHEIIAAVAETDLCKDLSNLNATLVKVFDSIDGVCENFKFCGIWPFSNAAEYFTDGNLGIEKHSLCGSVKFSGFTAYFGLNEDPDGSPIANENGIENYDIFRKKLIENVKDEMKNPSMLENAKDGKPYKIYDLKYTPGLQKLPIEFGDEVHLLKENEFEEVQFKSSAAAANLHLFSCLSFLYLFIAFLLAFYW
uniref:Uncharacterized protein n=1 Tax=Panagrolaimus sp. PS1159 TaxID=55785 RepID=A0AC35GDA1_9BILA